jgi:hypothetical protein
MYGVIDFTVIDTDPGAHSCCAPPVSFTGDENAYIDYMRQRWQQDAGFRQHVWFAANFIARGRDIKFTGAFATQAKAIVEKLARS